jgi:release factor glutamine methyltransferase
VKEPDGIIAMPVIEITDPDLRFKESRGVYPVREDSFLLMKTLIPFLDRMTGTFLEMGCGNGLTSVVAGLKGWRVISIDRNPFALVSTRYNIMMNECECELFLSDLFEGVPRSLIHKIDLMAFNPPYLPGSDIDLDPFDRIAIEGGSLGHETSLSFIYQAKRFLSKDARIVVLHHGPANDLFTKECVMLGYEVSVSHAVPDTDEGLNVIRLVNVIV